MGIESIFKNIEQDNQNMEKLIEEKRLKELSARNKSKDSNNSLRCDSQDTITEEGQRRKSSEQEETQNENKTEKSESEIKLEETESKITSLETENNNLSPNYTNLLNTYNENSQKLSETT